MPVVFNAIKKVWQHCKLPLYLFLPGGKGAEAGI